MIVPAEADDVPLVTYLCNDKCANKCTDTADNYVWSRMDGKGKPDRHYNQKDGKINANLRKIEGNI